MNFVNASSINLNRSNNSLIFLARVSRPSWQIHIFMVSLSLSKVGFDNDIFYGNIFYDYIVGRMKTNIIQK